MNKYLKPFGAIGLLCCASLFIFCVCRQPASFGDAQPLLIGHNMPYVLAKAGNAPGYFLVDFATDTTVIDVNALLPGVPEALGGNSDRYEIVVGNDAFRPPYIYKQAFNGINTGNVKQSGILGTDVLSKRIFTLDFQNKKLYDLKPGNLFYSDAQLSAMGFVPSTIRGYYSNDRKNNTDTTENIPTVQVILNGVAGVCQLDPGFDDDNVVNTLNINKAFLNALRTNGRHIQVVQGTNGLLTTCKVGVSDTTYEINIPPGNEFVITGPSGQKALINQAVRVFMKLPADASKSCGGIAAAKYPAAQIGLSILSKVPQLIFDPFTTRVWFKKTM